MFSLNNKSQEEARKRDWQTEFLAMLPQIEVRLRLEFGRLTPEAREEAVQAGVAHCVEAYSRLFAQGREEFAHPGTLAMYAARQFRAGRVVGVRLNIYDPLSRYAQQRKRITLKRLDRRCPATGGWLEEFVEDRRASIPDRVAMRIDVPAWFRGLSRRLQGIARDLAVGSTTAEIAQKYQVTAGRISQIRRELLASWHRFQGMSIDAA